MRVPVLVIDGQTITENPAIMLAISQLVPRKGLMGSTDREKVRVAEWLNWLSGTLHGQAFGGLLRPGRYVDDEGLFDAVREKGWKNVQEGFEMIEMWLGERQGGSGSGERLEQGGPSSGPEERHEGNSSSGPYALGEIFTGVDALLFVFYRWGVGKGFDMQKQYPRYAALFKEVGGREATVKALAAERVAAL